MAKGFGDRLAKGSAKAAFPAAEPGVAAEKFKEATKDFNLQDYLKGVETEENAARERKAQRIQAEQADAEKLDREREELRAQERAQENIAVDEETTKLF